MGDVVLPHPLMCLKWRSGKMGKDSSEKYLDNLQKKDYLLKMGNTYETTLNML